MSILSILFGVILGYGAAEEMIVRGFREGLLQPGILGAVGTIASGLLIACGVLMKRGERPHPMIVAAALLTIAVHTYGVLPPHHNIGYFAALLGTGFGLALLTYETLRRREA